MLCAACTLLEKTHTFSAFVSADSCDVDAASAKMNKIRLILDMTCMRVPPFSWVAVATISGSVTFFPRKSKFYLSVKHSIFRVRLDDTSGRAVEVCGELKLELQGVGEIKAADLANRFNDSPPPDIMYVWSKPYIKLNKKSKTTVCRESDRRRTKCYLHPVETVMLESYFNLRHGFRANLFRDVVKGCCLEPVAKNHPLITKLR